MAITRIGQGQNLVMLHGWGMNRAVFAPIAEALKDQFCCHLIDLPGFGERPRLTDEASIDHWLQAIMDDAPAQAIWLGWSLGGLLVQAAAEKFPERVQQQLLIASTPHFPQCNKTEWQGIRKSVLSQFAKQLQADSQTTIERFLAIQAMGSESTRQDVKRLRQHIQSLPNAHPTALADGLTLLAEVDFRALPSGNASWLLGKQDALVPVALANWLALQRPTNSVKIIAQASHAPFISHPVETVAWIRQQASLAT